METVNFIPIFHLTFSFQPYFMLIVEISIAYYSFHKDLEILVICMEYHLVEPFEMAFDF